MEALIHIANLLYLLAYSFRDMLWLRFITVLAGLTVLPYWCSIPDLPPSVLGWSLAFSSLNSILFLAEYRRRRRAG